jgi:hypothetical protein
MPSNTEQLIRLYDRFNARDVEAIISILHHEVIWANGMEGGYVHGHDGVREYWTRQWSRIDPHVEPMNFSTGLDGRIEVEVHQIVRDLRGAVMSDKRVSHKFQFCDGLIRRFDIDPALPSR